jgi:membrane protein
VRVRKRALVAKFFADRGTHLAAMIAYFALLSFVPLTFLALSLLGLTGRVDESTFLVQEIRQSLPGVPIVRIVNLVNNVRENAATIGIIGGGVLLWTALSFFSVLESAFNIVYDRPNRSFLQGKLLALVLLIGSLVTLFVALLAGSFGFAVLREFVPGLGNNVVAYALSVAVSTLGVFAFLVTSYYLLTNEDLRIWDVLPGSVLATIALEASFQVLPIYVRFAHVNAALDVFGGTAILLVWLYVMANVIVFGAELNWWFGRRREGAAEEALGLA